MHYTLCDMIADLAQNAVEAGSSVIDVSVDERVGALSFRIRDNGKGMNPALLERVKDPFYTDGIKHPSRKVGLGIPFLIQTASETGGSWELTSAEGKGTTVGGTFDTTNIDTPPVGDIPATFAQILTQSGSYEMNISRTRKGSEKDALDYRVSKTELTDALGELETAASLSLLRQYLAGLEEADAESE
jgi:hypothetical protein